MIGKPCIVALLLLLQLVDTDSWKIPQHSHIDGSNSFLLTVRGGETRSKKKKEPSDEDDSFHLLARALQPRLEDSDVRKIEKSLRALSTAQKAFKGLDGAAHEAYQRTHRTKSDASDEEELTSVSGRAKRSASRAASTAEAFLSAELCELLEKPSLLDDSDDGPLQHREIVFNTTQVRLTKKHNVSVLVLWEPSYNGGYGLNHGSIEDLVGKPHEVAKSSSEAASSSPVGRLLVVVSDPVSKDMESTLSLLDEEPLEIELQSGLVANELASVQSSLYKTAGRVLKAVERVLMTDERWVTNTTTTTETAIHFVGRSLGGGVAALAATILDGTLPMPSSNRQQRRRKRRQQNASNNSTESAAVSIEGFARGRCSAMLLGPPPCLSANVKAAFVKSIIYGDDAICRTTRESLQRLTQRTKRAMKGGVLGRQVGWMTDAVSLTVSRGWEFSIIPFPAFDVVARGHDAFTGF